MAPGLEPWPVVQALDCSSSRFFVHTQSQGLGQCFVRMVSVSSGPNLTFVLTGQWKGDLKDVVSRGKVESMTSPVLTLWTLSFTDQQ